VLNNSPSFCRPARSLLTFSFVAVLSSAVILSAQEPLSQPVQNATASTSDKPGIKVFRNRVDPRNRYHRILCVVPLIGAGTRQDPRRPQYTPSSDTQTPSLNGIIGFQQIPTDSKLFAIVEFVAADASALSPIWNDKSLKIFERGKHSRALIEAEFKLFRKDFDLTQFGMAVR